MQRLLVVVLASALQAAAVSAPFAHLHVDAPHQTSHHDGRVLHAHAHSHLTTFDPTGAWIDPGDDENGHWVPTHVAVARELPPSLALTVVGWGVAAPGSEFVGFVPLAAQDRDPPPRSPDRARAPPA